MLHAILLRAMSQDLLMDLIPILRSEITFFRIAPIPPKGGANMSGLVFMLPIPGQFLSILVSL